MWKRFYKNLSIFICNSDVNVYISKLFFLHTLQWNYDEYEILHLSDWKKWFSDKSVSKIHINFKWFNSNKWLTFEEFNNCYPDLCINGTCIDGDNTHTCSCFDGYKGVDCDGKTPVSISIFNCVYVTTGYVLFYIFYLF